MRAFMSKLGSRRSFLERLFFSTGVAFLSTSALQILSAKNADEASVPKKFILKFKYTAKNADDIDAYIKSIMTPAMLDFRNYWKNTKKVVVSSAREDLGKSIISSHLFQTEKDLKEFWEAAKYIPGKAERETYGITRDYSIITLPA